jgi:PAS domain S-box-containing protein
MRTTSGYLPGSHTLWQQFLRWWGGSHPFWSSVNQAVAGAHRSVAEIGEMRRAQLSAWIAVLLALLFAMGSIASIIVRGQFDMNVWILIILAGLSMVAYGISRTRYYSWSGWLITGSMVIVGYVFVLLGLGASTSLDSFIPLAFILGSILLTPAPLAFWIVVGIGAMFFVPARFGLDVGTLSGIYLSLGSLLFVSVIFRNGIERQRMSELRGINAELRKANASVEAASRRTRIVFQTLSEGVGVTDPAGNLVEVNESLLRLAGYDRPEELLGKQATVLVAESERSRMSQNFSFGLGLGKPAEYQMVALDQNRPGEVRLYDGEMTVSVLQDEQDQRAGFVTVVRDITLQKQAAEAIRMSEARQRQILDSIPASILITRLPDGGLLYANQTMVEQFGLLPEQIAGKTTPDLYYDLDDRDRLLSILRDQGSLNNFVARAKRQDNGQMFWGELSGRMIDFAGERALLTAIIDVTARRHAEENLHARDEALQKYSAVIARLSRSGNIIRGDLQAALEEITEAVSTTLEVQRASVWFYNAERTQVQRADLYEEGRGHARGGELSRSDFPGYFAALQSEKAIVADDAHAHPSTREFLQGYLAPLGINSRLDVPIRLQGRVTGVLCCEHTGPKRHWTLEEESFVTSTVDFVTSALVAQERVKLTRQIEESFERRGQQVQVSTQIAQDISTATELNDLFQRVVTLVKERFGYYYTQLLRYEPAQNAVVLIVGYGEVGEKMLQARHRLPMGTGLIGAAAATGETVLRSELVNDPDWRPNPMLPETKGEIAVPIMLRGQVLGVLDVQSDQAGALTQDDVILLEGLCGQVAVAIEETRLRQEMEERLRELNSLYAAMSHQGWQSSQNIFQTDGYVYNRVAVMPLAADEPVAQSASTTQSQPFAVVPLAVHGTEHIGAVSVEDDPDHPLSEEDLAFVEQVAEQVALALESSRLFTQTQAALAETRLLYNLASRISAAIDLQEIVAVAAEETHIPDINRGVLMVLGRDQNGEVDQAVVRANWHNGQGNQPTPVGTQYTQGPGTQVFDQFSLPEPVFVDEADQAIRQGGIGSMAVLPLWVGGQQTGALILQSDQPHHFTDQEKRPMSALAQQVAIAMQSRLLLEQMQRSREQLSEALRIASMGYLEVDLQTQVLVFSEEYYRLLHTSAETEGGYQMPLADFASKFMQAEGLHAMMDAAQTSLDAKADQFEIELQVTCADGQQRWLRTQFSFVRNEQGEALRMLGAAQDVTERKQTREALARRARELSTVADLGTRISAVLDPDQMLHMVVDLVKDSFALYHAHVYLLDEPGDALILTAGAGEVGRQMVAQGWQIPVEGEKSLVARVARTRQGVIVNDVLADADFMPNELLPHTRAELAVPMMVGERVLGVLDIQSDEINRFTSEDVAIQTVLASQVAVALQNARTYAQTQRQAEYEAMINAISQKIQSTTSVENALQVAVRELGRALGASRTSVQLSAGKGGRP